MKKPHLYLYAVLAALVMLAAVPAKAADVKELFAIDLPDYPGKEGRVIEVSYPRAHKTWSIATTPMRTSTCSMARSSCS